MLGAVRIGEGGGGAKRPVLCAILFIPHRGTEGGGGGRASVVPHVHAPLFAS